VACARREGESWRSDATEGEEEEVVVVVVVVGSGT
jgi:hypothetical protein